MNIIKTKIEAFQGAATRCLERDGHVMPAFAFVQNGEMKMAMTQFRDADDKDCFADFMVGIIRDLGVREYLTINEAWILAEPLGEDRVRRHLNRHGSLESAPGREEAIIMVHCTPCSETMYVAKISRDNGHPRLGPWECHERNVPAMGAADTGSRFMGLFAKAAGGLN